MAYEMGFDKIFEETVGKLLPDYAKPAKVIGEVSEHTAFYKWVVVRILAPLSVFYFVAGLFLGEYVVGTIIFSLFVFLYGAFLPDFDSFISSNSKVVQMGRPARKHEKYLVLLLAPFYLYYVLSERIRPIHCSSQKPFHNKKALLVFGLFLFLLGIALYASPFNAFFLAAFGSIGYATHLFVDKTF